MGLLTISRDAVSTKSAPPKVVDAGSAALIPAVRLGRIWQVRLGERPRSWTIAPGGDADRADALTIRREVYGDRYGRAWPVEEEALDARGFLCVVRLADGTPVASLRVIGADDRPLEIESQFSLDELLPAESRPAEIGRFAILPNFRRMGTGIHMALFQWSYALARRDRFSHFLMVSPVDVRPIYDFLLFQPVPGATYEHPWLKAGVCTPMVLDLRDLPVRYRASRHAFARLLDTEDALAPELRVG